MKRVKTIVRSRSRRSRACLGFRAYTYVYLLIIALESRESAAAGLLDDRRVRDESVTLLFPPYARSDAGTVVDVIEDRAATVKQALGQSVVRIRDIPSLSRESSSFCDNRSRNVLAATR